MPPFSPDTADADSGYCPRTMGPRLPSERAWRWCVLATLRDLRLGCAGGRAMSLPNTRRVFLRRFGDVCHGISRKCPPETRRHWERLGGAFIRQQYARQVARFFKRSGGY